MTKAHLDDLPEFQFLVLSLKHSPGWAGKALWWAPNAAGYVEEVNAAGRYTQEEIEAKPGYYNDGVDALAIREDVVLRESSTHIFAPHQDLDWWRKKIGGTG
jgi:hypothetical protein